MQQKATRSLGGALALWVFYAYCAYVAWAMIHTLWDIATFHPTDAAHDRWWEALPGFLQLGLVGVMLGGIAWYTRPRRRPE